MRTGERGDIDASIGLLTATATGIQNSQVNSALLGSWKTPILWSEDDPLQQPRISL
jgi:hypothetical protein